MSAVADANARFDSANAPLDNAKTSSLDAMARRAEYSSPPASPKPASRSATSSGGSPSKGLPRKGSPSNKPRPSSERFELTSADKAPIKAASRIRVHGGFSVTTVTGETEAERHGKRGINREDFCKQLRTLSFPPAKSLAEEATLADLWTNQVRPAADEAFSAMIELVRGQNFFMEVSAYSVPAARPSNSPISPNHSRPSSWRLSEATRLSHASEPCL